MVGKLRPVMSGALDPRTVPNECGAGHPLRDTICRG